MTWQDLLPLAIPLVLDWAWDKMAKRRAEKQAEDVATVIRKSLSEMGAAGDAAVARIDEGMTELARTTSRWQRSRWSTPPPLNGDREATNPNIRPRAKR